MPNRTNHQKLYAHESIWAESKEKSFDFKDMPTLNSIINGNFVDLLMENMCLLQKRKQQSL